MDNDLDLELTRLLTAPPGNLPRCWTEPELLKRWFCPPPYRVTRAEIDPRPGGIFLTVMQGPEGASFREAPGCILAAEPARLFAFTDALGPGFRPHDTPFMTAIITFDAHDAGTRYRALVRHASATDRERHEAMGFHAGWGTATAQLDALAATL